MSTTFCAALCLLCPQDEDGYYLQFDGRNAGKQLSTHLITEHHLTGPFPMQMVSALSGDFGHAVDYAVEDRDGRRVGRTRTVTKRGTQ